MMPLLFPKHHRQRGWSGMGEVEGSFLSGLSRGKLPKLSSVFPPAEVMCAWERVQATARSRGWAGPRLQAAHGSNCPRRARGAVPSEYCLCALHHASPGLGCCQGAFLNVGFGDLNLLLALSLRCQGIKRQTYPKLCHL